MSGLLLGREAQEGGIWPDKERRRKACLSKISRYFHIPESTSSVGIAVGPPADDDDDDVFRVHSKPRTRCSASHPIEAEAPRKGRDPRSNVPVR